MQNACMLFTHRNSLGSWLSRFSRLAWRSRLSRSTWVAILSSRALLSLREEGRMGEEGGRGSE